MWKRSLVGLVAILMIMGCSQPEAKSESSNSSNDEESATTSAQEDRATARHDVIPASMAMADDEMEARLRLPDVVERVMPSVVGVATQLPARRQAPTHRSPLDDFFRDFGFPHHPSPHSRPSPQPREQPLRDVGSGVIVDTSGVVITNHHVIDNAERIVINLSDGRELDAVVEGTDPESDIAVLRIEDPPDDLQAIAFGDSDALRLGESVIAIGNPFGLSGTVTLGIISAKGRAGVGLLDYENFIQTDAAINPGNSGGALLNLDGELVGINTAILTRSGGYQGVGFAIPSNMAEMVMRGLLEDGRVDRGWLGVVIQSLTPALAEALGLDEGVDGVVVSDVQRGSPAEEVGIERGDVITSIAGRSVSTAQELRNAVGLRSPGDEVEMRYIREGVEQRVSVTLGSNQDMQAFLEGRTPGDPRADSGIEGLTLRPLDSEMRRRMSVPDAVPGGVVVSDIEAGTKASRYNLQEGDIILEVNRRPVRTVEEFAAAYEPERPRNLFLLYRDGATIFLTQ